MFLKDYLSIHWFSRNKSHLPNSSISILLTLLWLLLQSTLLSQIKDTIPYRVNLKAISFNPVGGVSADSVKIIQSNLDRMKEDTLLAKVGKVHVLLQLEKQPTRFEKENIKRYGVELLNYIPPNTWIAAISKNISEVIISLEPLNVKWIGNISPEMKKSEAVKNELFESYVLLPDNRTILLVQFHKTISLEVAKQIILQNGGEINDEIKSINSLVITIPKNNINSLASHNAVLWIDQAPARMSGTNDGVRQAANVNPLRIAPYNLDGTGVTVMVFDGGLVDNNHPDFGTRVTHGETSVIWNGDNIGVQDHPTHVAGTLGGDGGESNTVGGTANQWQGVAPAVNIISYGIDWNGTGTFLYDNLGDLEEDFDQAINDHDADIATASVGTNISANRFNCNLEGDYNATDQLIDNIVKGELGRPIITTWAAGNERGGLQRCGTSYRTINPPANAKNPIHVGAINSDNNSMTTFSGWGPTDDGRLKPVIVAPGDQVTGDGAVTSTVPNLFIDNSNLNCAPGVMNPPNSPNTNRDDYCFPYSVMVGTSMATPAVAGIISLMLQQYWDTYNTTENPLPSTIKAILIHTAQDLGNPGPDFQFGYGLVNAQASVDLIRNGQSQIIESQINEDDELDIFNVNISGNPTEFKVSLAWDDVQGTILAAKELINDLNLILEDPNGTIHRPWVLDHTAGNEGNNATRDIDDLNNMEQVTVQNPVAGLWKIKIKGEDIPEPIQKYSLVSDFPFYFANNVSVVQVIDRTGSMSYRDDQGYPTYMESAKIAAKNFLGLMQLGDEVGVVAFDDPNCNYQNGTAEARFNLVEMTTEATRNNAITSIDVLNSRGCTSIGVGMQLAQIGPNFLDVSTSDNAQAMILLTDGFENTPPWVRERPPHMTIAPTTPNNILLSIPDKTDIYTIALGTSADEDLLKDIASTTGGKYYQSPTILGLLSIYYQIHGDLELGDMTDLAVGTKSSGNDTRKVVIDPQASKATFAIGWLQENGRLTLSVKDPNGNPVNSGIQGVTSGTGSTYSYITVINPMGGEWEVHITRDDRETFNIDYTFAAFVNGANKTWSFIPTFEEAGECLLTKVNLFDDRTLQPITGATVKAVITCPKESKFTLHYNLVKAAELNWDPKIILQPKLLTRTTTGPTTQINDELPLWTSRLQEYNMANIKETGYSIFKYDTLFVQLFDDGSNGDLVANDGIYTICINKTQIAGSYNISFLISGVSAAGYNFERRIISSTLIEPGKIDPSRVLVRVDPQIINLEEGSEGVITIVPMDRFGNVWGPGQTSKISLSTTAGILQGDVIDNGDGFYFQKIVSSGTQVSGKIDVKIDDTEIDTHPLVTFGFPLNHFGLSVHSGVAIPTGDFANNFDPGVNFLLDAGYYFNENWAIVGFFGYNKFISKIAGSSDSEIWNVSLNLRYYKSFSTMPGTNWSYYIGAGPGIYIPKVGDTKFGYNFGAGINYAISPTITGEFGVDYHKTFNDIQFIHNHVGVIFRF